MERSLLTPNFVLKLWSSITLPEVFLHEDGYFIVKFQTQNDRDEILYAGPYTLNNKPIILNVWTPNFDFNEEFLRTLPLWIKFPNLPLNCWGPDSLSRIACGIGSPIYVDECTAKQTRITYARVLVEVDVTEDIPYLPLLIFLTHLVDCFSKMW